MSFGQAAVSAEVGGQTAGEARGQARVSRGGRLALGLVGLWAVASVLTLLPGALVLSRHEGDAMHLAAMVLRMAEGQWPHLDYMTPIGVLAVAPIAGLVALGLGLGQAFIWAQILIAAALLPMVWWVAMSRFRGGVLGVAFGALVIGMVMAFVHGGTVQSISISMHYNRWAWAVAFLVMALILLPPNGRKAPRIEGAFIGVALAALALTKVTYAVALVPAVVLALALRRDWAGLIWGVGAGLAALALVTLWAGFGFWTAYVADLLSVATSDTRPTPGRSLSDVLVSPQHIAGTLIGLGAIVLLRRSGRAREGVILAALLPGLVLITWQNFGNDAQWLAALALVLLVLRPAAEGTGYIIVATAALALSVGWMMNMAVSPLRVAGTDVAASGPMFPEAGAHADFRLVQKRLDKVTVEAAHPSFTDAPDAPDWGAALPDCDLVSGGVRLFQAIAAELTAAGFAGRQVLVADTFQSFWLLGDFPALPGGTPWYYGGLPGGAAAEIVVVPLCPINDKARARVLDAVDAARWQLTERFRGTHVSVLEIARP
ncbi:MAG: hypothetical protein AAGG09_14105 [Pseudomonadota bacterium]